jgi:hypothetical protein
MDGRKDDIAFLIDLQGKIWMLKYCSFILLLLFGTNVILHVRDNRRNTREKTNLTQELNTLKAKMYDIQEGKKSSEQILNK